MGLNATLAMAGRSLEVFQAGIEVAGDNISNAQTPGYVREKLVLEAEAPYRQGNLFLGTGVDAPAILQQIDQFLESRIHTANGDFHASQARETIYQHLETELRELGKTDLSTGLNEFLGAVHDVVNQPEALPLREVAVRQGVQFADTVGSLRHRIDELRRRYTGKAERLVEEANKQIRNIADLNRQISLAEEGGALRSEAGTLRSKRYQALNRLSEIIDIRYTERKNGTVDVFTGSDYLVLAGTSQELRSVTEADRGVRINRVQLTGTESFLSSPGGELGGTLEGRDRILGGFVDQLNKYTSQLIETFNGIHASGEGLRGFSSVTGTNEVQSTSDPLNADAAGLAFKPDHGSFQLKVTNAQTGISKTTEIDVDLDGVGTETSLEDLRDSIDAVANVNAEITPDGRLKISAGSDFEFRFARDSSGALAALGINTFFTGSDSSNIGVNEVVQNDADFFATGQGGGPSDGRNAIELAAVAEQRLDALDGRSLTEYYESVVSSVAQSSASESTMAEGFKSFRDSLLNQRSQFSGVSIDEEAIKVLEFQRAFQASARVISTVDELFGVLLNL